MKTIHTILAATALAGISLLGTSCSSRVYERAAAYTLAGDDTYGFAETRVEKNYDKMSAPLSMTVTVTRGKSAEEAIVPLRHSDIPGVPQAVVFEAGSRTATFEVDLSSVGAGCALNDTIRFANGVRTQKGSGFMALDIAMNYTWMQISSCDRAYSLLTDDVVATTVRGRKATFPVIIEEAIERPGMYRLVNAMKGYDTTAGVTPDAASYIVVNATDPERVTIDKQSLGVDLGRGELAIESLASYFLAEGRHPVLIEDARCYGRLENGVITFPRASSFNLWMGGNATSANLTGSFRIVLPERVAEMERTLSKEDYDLGVEYLARVGETPAFELNPAAISTDSYALSK